MKNLFLILFSFTSFLVFSQAQSKCNNTFVTNYDYLNSFYPKYPLDTISKNFNGKFTTEKMYILESVLPEKSNNLYITNSDKFTNKLINNFIVDNPNNPTELIFEQTGIKFKLYPYCDSYIEFFNNFDSCKLYKTDSDFNITIFYSGNFIESVIFFMDNITNKTYDVAELWYKSKYKNKKLDKYQILKLWINETFMKDLYHLLPNENYSDELLQKGIFEFFYTNEYLKYSSISDKWFPSEYDEIIYKD